ncbi:peptidase T [Halobacillus shinanisalinarum]|uniref:Peptidase T n=1 Tax=Halobacillus shinanisalinarum TaxID=2932258 RepID=A0ABY4H4Z5_9BACI|nr:peptidase T [Halobacillus shinanisalinarum]UOQ95175.1 peptidase T [Halobacillus shinanisalinarum]
MKDEILRRFTSYVKIDTQSDESNDSCPSTEGQLTLAKKLVEELKGIGMEEVTLDGNGYVMATLPANTDKDLPVIGFLAHVDTARDFTGQNVHPQVVENYDGGDIHLNEEVVLSPRDFEELPTYKGHTLVTTNSTTLLGADNKAGVSEIMTAMHYLIDHPDIKHGKVRVAFTPDEEIGRGPHKFDVKEFGADFAYTVDGGPLGELQYESFNAADVKITFNGNSVHPGTAKGKMVNASKLAVEFIEQLPEQEAPEYTSEYEGFYHLVSLQSDVEAAQLYYLIRDFDKTAFAARKDKLLSIVTQIKENYGEDSVSIELNDQYYNMRDKIEPMKEIVDVAYRAMTNLSITPIVQPIRGGTDGSQLSYMGLPTPNLFTGGENFHGKYEYVSLENMVESTRVIVEICKLFVEEA